MPKGVISHDDIQPVEMLAGVVRRTLAVTDRLMLCEIFLRAGSEVPVHTHPHDQVGYVVSGDVVMIVDGEEVRCKPGDAYAIPGGVPHGARPLADTVVIDVFHPPREDYLDA